LNKLNINEDEKKIILQSIYPTQLENLSDYKNIVIIPPHWTDELTTFCYDDIKWFNTGIKHNGCVYTRDITTNTTLTKMEEYSKHFCEKILTHWKVFKVESDKISMLDLQNNSTKNHSIEELENYECVCSYGQEVEMYGYLLIKSLIVCESDWRIINSHYMNNYNTMMKIIAGYYDNSDDDDNNDNNNNDDDNSNDDNSDDNNNDDNKIMIIFNVDYSQDIMLKLEIFLNKLDIDDDEKNIILRSIILTQLDNFDNQKKKNTVIIPDDWTDKLLMFRSDDVDLFCSSTEHNNSLYTRDITTNTTLTKIEEYSKHFCERILTHLKLFKVESDKISMLDLQNNSTKNYIIELEEDYGWVCLYGQEVEMYGYLLIKSLMICESDWRINNNNKQ
jgi:hypothetical protein